ncbi:unnamed protein product [Bursaphelenchus xylophilus]|uniref:(pine wood nematode) hypothetical protein n=1 Tax=Bursaphelenchus xylophilus TaxID=6326 RepID=A0A1I7SB25_BURXY|nr:unnamed protein product [Bursaphelenchus xylophilus]CAG9131703.1 unnamed protein product [Bursaphelenchus xylophilus]
MGSVRLCSVLLLFNFSCLENVRGQGAVNCYSLPCITNDECAKSGCGCRQGDSLVCAPFRYCTCMANLNLLPPPPQQAPPASTAAPVPTGAAVAQPQPSAGPAPSGAPASGAPPSSGTSANPLANSNVPKPSGAPASSAAPSPVSGVPQASVGSVSTGASTTGPSLSGSNQTQPPVG